MHQHLRDAHRLPLGLDSDLTIQLHAAKDYPDRSENVLGYYEGTRLVALHLRITERPADDPMRFS